MSDPILFYSDIPEFKELSNFWVLAQPIVYEGLECPTTEHAFQASKFLGQPGKKALEYAQKIAESDTPSDAYYMGRQKKRAGRPKPGSHVSQVNEMIEKSLDSKVTIRPDWNDVRDKVMKDILRLKFFRDEHCQEVLLSTGDRPLIEHTSRDRYWADGGDGKGRNRLGQLLEEVRAELREEIGGRKGKEGKEVKEGKKVKKEKKEREGEQGKQEEREKEREKREEKEHDKIRLDFDPIEAPDAEVYICQDFLSEEDAEELYDIIDDQVPWKKFQVRMGGNVYDQPRDSAYIGDEGVSFYYSGFARPRDDWIPALDLLRNYIQDIVRQLNPNHPPINAVLCNRYKDGSNHIQWHSDALEQMNKDAFICSVSLGAQRKFVLRRIDDHSKKTTIPLKSGSLLLMGPGTQEHYQHTIPKSASVKEPRINLTFRSFPTK